MTSQEAQSTARIAALMRTGRKRAGFTQVELARRLDISQSALSKIESGLLVPSAPQWFEFCVVARIPADSFYAGVLDEGSLAELRTETADTPFKLPEKYRANRGSKVRALLPILSYFRECVGARKYGEYFRELRMDPDFFNDLDEQVSLMFLLDLARELTRRKALSPALLPRISGAVRQPRMHGVLQRDYDRCRDRAGRARAILANARRYECNFSYRIEDEGSQRLSFSVRPEEHLEGVAYRGDPVLGTFLCDYKKHYFGRFLSDGEDAPEVVIRERECHFHGAAACVYEVPLR